MKNIWFVLVITCTLYGQISIPLKVSISTDFDSTIVGLRSNTIIEIRSQGSRNVWLGTGRGLSVVSDSTKKDSSIQTFYTSSNLIPGDSSIFMPVGGVSAIAVAASDTTDQDTIISAVAISQSGVSTGNGLAISFIPDDTSGVQWRYFRQPVDSADADTILWGGQQLRVLPITVPEQNVTYDISINPDYYWITCWAGGLRRLNRWSSIASWEPVPLPMDRESELICGQVDSVYQLNPRDPPLGQHNHKGFSVLSYRDTVWVGTADGINRGIMDGNGCVDWYHYKSPESGITGNWVVSIAKQEINGIRKIWAVTLSTGNAGEINGISYTMDDGETWESVPALRGERGYNIHTLNNLVYVATEKGLWKSEDGVNFALYEPAIDADNNDQILDNNVYAVIHDDRPYWRGPDPGTLWVGTGDGLARTPDPTSNSSIWKIFRYIDTNTPVYAYPNPFSPNKDNILNGDGYVRFRYKVRKSQLIRMNIFNFAMEKVYEFDYRRDEVEGTLKWNGRDSNGNLVANGVYFINMFYDDNDHWVKLIVVK